MADPPTALDVTFQLLQALSIPIASGTAIWGIWSWRRETLGRRKIELAEETLAAFYRARDCIRQVRSPLVMSGEVQSREPIEGETPHEKSYRDSLYAPAERLMNRNELFAELEASSYRFAALFGEEARKPITELLRVRNEIFIAVDGLIRRSIDRSAQGPEKEDASTKRHYQDLEKTIGWTSPKEDELGAKLDRALKDMEEICRPVLLGRPSAWKRFAAWCWLQRKTPA